MSSLFKDNNKSIPLADKIRPTSINDVFGQEHLFTENSQITQMINASNIQNLILWGPPGTGKTTIARILAQQCKYHTESISAVINATNDIKQIFNNAKNRKDQGVNTLLIVDEIHHFNKSQQDIFLPFLEDGTITLIGATTENPSFELNNALLSRCMVLNLEPLNKEALIKIVNRAEVISQKKLPLKEDDRDQLYKLVDGDGRYLLNICEGLLSLENNNKNPVDLASIFQMKSISYDKSRDQHYNIISALHKSIRGSDSDASLYWVTRMLESGENPHYILRRLVRISSEDIGLADPNALTQVLSAKEAYDFLGSPEGNLSIIQAALYLATAPKSNAIYLAQKQSIEDVNKHGSLIPPHHILNAPTKLMKNQGYGAGYIYDHDTAECFSGQNYFPEKMGRKKYYTPTQRGFEKDISKRLDYWNNLRKKKT